MEILKKQEVEPIRVKCYTCESELGVMPEDLEGISAKVYRVPDKEGNHAWGRITCPVCKCEITFDIKNLRFAVDAHNHLCGRH